MFNSERYFFHLVSGSEVIPDEKGVDLWTDEGLLSQILQAVDEFIDEAVSLNDWHGWWLEVMDGTGGMVLSIPLTGFDRQQSLLH
jgi:hypothetical protein